MNTLPKTVVIGLGPTGLSCVRYLYQKGIPVVVTDSRDHPPALPELQEQFPDVPVAVGGFSESFIASAEQLVVSPGVACDHPLIAAQIVKGVPVIGDVELFARDVSKPVIGITGSNGKTTVTILVGRMVEAAGYSACVCGNIGRQVLDALSDAKPDFYVMELSSFQLETTYSLKTETAVVLNISPDHMDRYADFSDYVVAKRRIYNNCVHPVVNLDEPAIWERLDFDSAPLGFTLNEPKREAFGLRQESGEWYLAHGELLLAPVKSLLLQGQHHYQNALSALALGYAVGLPMDVMLTVIRTFQGVAHRCQLVDEKNGVRWINDSKGTNVGATIAAIQTMKTDNGHLILIAGGDAKAADLTPLRAPIEASVAHALLFGQDADAIAKAIDGVVPCDILDSLESAVNKAATLAKPGDTVLLSPACASFDMFKNFEHRGQVFIDLVKALPQ